MRGEQNVMKKGMIENDQDLVESLCEDNLEIELMVFKCRLQDFEM